MLDDRGDFEGLYTASRQRLLGFVYLITGDLGEAQDVVQEAFARAWQRWSSVRRHPDPEAWVRLTASRIAVSWWRRMRSRVVDLVAAMARLPEEQRITLALHYLAGLPVAIIADELGVAVGTVKARLSRGRTALGTMMRVETVDA
ncbi:SigE family RNA polymerase sigma factor [Catelliglobosispora koreensis]|uniref:SigE family RNA polymerase sigma factor n=1 Tax=Catelliglobosispora koreensis TaxID=129052 RepID=UPI000379C36F|nr:SigE family RNA polymerase sigma factor [Catelliglobosispora koreensis]